MNAWRNHMYDGICLIFCNLFLPHSRAAPIGLFSNYLGKNQMIFLLFCEHRYIICFKIVWVQYFGISSVRKLSCVKFLDFQILDWLSHSPTDIESYIRPGCIVLTIYLRLPESTWEEVSFFLLKTQKYVITVLFPGNTTYIPCFDCFIQLCCDLGSSLSRLLDVSNDTFWRTGWVYIRVQHQIAFIYNGLFPPPPFFPLDFFFCPLILSH